MLLVVFFVNGDVWCCGIWCLGSFTFHVDIQLCFVADCVHAGDGRLDMMFLIIIVCILMMRMMVTMMIMKMPTVN